jgi:hypothetical protein
MDKIKYDQYIHARVTTATHDAIREAADQKGCNMSEVVREIVDKWADQAISFNDFCRDAGLTWEREGFHVWVGRGKRYTHAEWNRFLADFREAVQSGLDAQDQRDTQGVGLDVGVQ